MKRLNIPKGKKFAPKVPEEELNERTEERVAECGVGNAIQAMYTCEISKNVVGSKNPVFKSIQPQVKQRNTNSWNTAFIIAIKYLQQYQMNTTLETIQCETAKRKFNLNNSFIGTQKTSNFLADLIHRQINSRESFDTKVKQFVKEEHLDEVQNNPSYNSILPSRNKSIKTYDSPMKTKEKASKPFAKANASPVELHYKNHEEEDFVVTFGKHENYSEEHNTLDEIDNEDDFDVENTKIDHEQISDVDEFDDFQIDDIDLGDE